MIYIYGTGGFAKEVANLMAENGQLSSFGGFVDLDHKVADAKGQSIFEKDVITESAFLSKSDVQLVIAIGDPKTRQKTVEDLPPNVQFATLIHHTASVGQGCTLSAGCIICAGCVVTVDVDLGAHAQLNLGTTIGHDVKAGSYFTTAPSTNISGDCTFGDRVYMGTGSATRQGLTICADTTIGMGAMVVKNCVESGTYVGIPAKRLIR